MLALLGLERVFPGREQLSRAIVSGVRHILYSPSIRMVLSRTLVTGLNRRLDSALMPLVARDFLRGGAQTYGIMLGAFGFRAILGGLLIGGSPTPDREAALGAWGSMGCAIAGMAVS